MYLARAEKTGPLAAPLGSSTLERFKTSPWECNAASRWFICALWFWQCSMCGAVRSSWHLRHAGSTPRTYFPAPPGNRVVPILRRVMALSSTMLAEYLSGGLRVFTGLSPQAGVTC
ncbi:hypothetical protein DPMN_129616 [Dreissena polymorpha]|uniref:Uncharacterized protein n=1 Tax=Dreissena polymorpha TaxID=45954 RepID=A0A9D4JXJ4_DREPO|nr:hypothetical protein DPMN_129616 [Dreissena polymorpha]